MWIDDHNHAEKKPARGLQLTSRTPTMEELSEEMIMEIFLRLPARTLSCMKSVAERSYRIVGSGHGMLCLLHVDDVSCGHMHAVLWNPCTGFTFQSPRIRGYAKFCGFGYDHLSASYKFCGIIRKLGLSSFENSARIYTFGPNSPWRRIDDIPTDEDLSMADNKKGVYFGSSRECTLNWSFCHVVYYFDLSKETYGHFALPHRDSDDYDPWRRRMKEYGDAQSWTKLAMIPFHSHRPLIPLYISETDLLLLIIYPGFKVVVYNLKDGGFPVIEQFPHVIEKFNY
ncbi:hypothetical protein PIB30_081840, partial [Stylosanthes scabra]|nr:hypothetical protein [Stylosanthes scabra]